jgi:hypothetical protein
MRLVYVAFAAAVVIAAAGSGVAAQEAAQAPPPAPPSNVKPPPMTLVLGGKTFVAPVRGEAVIEFMPPTTRREKDFVVTRFTVKNASDRPIARFTISETWYGKAQEVISGGKGSLTGLLEPGAVATVVIQSPFRPGMTSNQFNFTHANGSVKPVRVPKIDQPKPTPPPT